MGGLKTTLYHVLLKIIYLFIIIYLIVYLEYSEDKLKWLQLKKIQKLSTLILMIRI